MSNCSDLNLCPNGNCEGCLNGEVWCQDPLCDPYCQNCQIDKEHDAISFWILAIIFFALLVLLFIYYLFFGPSILYFHDDYTKLSY